MMKHRFLEITFRRGRPFAAYLYLPRKPGDKSVRSERQPSGLLIDYAEDGRPIGIEITAPSKVTLASFNKALAAANQEPVTLDDLAPLLSAQPPASQRST
jgi:uncharacterized protein YuzE